MEPSKGQDVNLGLASHSLSCNQVGNPQGLLAGHVSVFSDILVSTAVLEFFYEGAIKPPVSQTYGIPRHSLWVPLTLRPLGKGKPWLDSALPWPLGSGHPGYLGGLISLTIQFQFGVGLTNCWRHETLKNLGSGAQPNVDTWLHHCRCYLEQEAELENGRFYINVMGTSWYLQCGATGWHKLKRTKPLTSVHGINTQLATALIIKIIFRGLTLL